MRPVLRRLPQTLVNQIAAGEVVERPAAAVKELVENAIDAGATRIDVTLEDGGRSLIRVADNGRGMTPEDLLLAVERHATSKLPDDDLVNIQHLGFRGEALPSIGSVSRLTLTSRPAGADSAFELTVSAGDVATPRPASAEQGTTIEVRDLFFATPARLKFLKGERAEYTACVDVMTRLAMVHPGIAMTVGDGRRQSLKLRRANAGGLFADRLERLTALIGEEFARNAQAVDYQRDDLTISGYAGLPTYNRANSTGQYIFVNGRPVRDRLLSGVVRAAYRDVLAPGRHPVAVLYIEAPADTVDVNVHPAKTEVRFRDAAAVRSLVINGIQKAVFTAGHQARDASDMLYDAVRPDSDAAPVMRYQQDYNRRSTGGYSPAPSPAGALADSAFGWHAPPSARTESAETSAGAELTPPADSSPFDPETGEEFPLGAAKAQLFKNYIVAQADDRLVLVDQHAAHERIVYEQMKAQLIDGIVSAQALLIPEVVELPVADVLRLDARADELSPLGLDVEAFGEDAVVVRAVPALLGNSDAKALVLRLAQDLADIDETVALKDRLAEVCAGMACHGSVRSGRILNAAEMNSLLRQMEATPRSGQCNHGRPTYVELDLKAIERLFERR